MTWMLTAVPGFLSTALLTLFSVFGRPDIGLVVAALLFLPIAAGTVARLFSAAAQGEAFARRIG